MNLSLREYQHDLINNIRSEYRHGAEAVLLQSPTGSGKTIMFAYITESAARKGKRIIILVHRQELLLQTSRALFGIGVQHGIIAPGHSMTKDHVQVASVQTLVRRLAQMQAPDLLIIDEAHHTAAGSWQKILAAYPEALLLGVTATPTRLDGKGLGKKSGGVFDTLVNGPSVKYLTELGFLSPSVVYCPKTDIDLSGLRRKFGDFIASEVNERVDKPTITGSAVEHYLKLCPGVPAIAFCASVKHAEHVARQFNEAGISAVSIDGTMPDWERKSAIYGLAKGRYKLLSSCDIVSEGTDIPVVTAGILLRPTQSTGLCLQQMGRTLRIFPGKTESIILDHVGNCLKHGFPDDEREWSLDGENNGKRKNGGNEVIFYTQCEGCYRLFPKTDPACPNCGWVRPVMSREIETVEGELKRITQEEKEALRINMRKEVGKARTKEELEAVARARGYKSGWVYNIMRARQK